jgi:uncharacterized membrane protein
VKKWYPVVLVLLTAAFSAWAYPRMPERVVTHWGLFGEPNGWSSRLSTVLEFPALMALFAALFFGIRELDPRKANYKKFAQSFDVIVVAVLFAIAAIHVMIIGVALGWPIPIRRAAPAVVGLLLLTLGNVLPRVRPNSFIGIRNPWTFSDNDSWSLAQRLAGYGLVVSGALFLLDGAVATPWADTLAISATVVAVVGTTLYSVVRGISSGG